VGFLFPTGDDLCDDLNDVGSLEFVYTGNNSDDLSDFQPDGKSSVITYGNGDVNGLANVRIIATDESDFTKILDPGTTKYFDGQVALGEAFTASGNFASNTYFYLDENNNVLQRIQYHTSCSAPIVLGDTIGALGLASVTDIDGTVFGASAIGVDADQGPGPVATIGEDVTFTYLVTNDGETELENVKVIDDAETPNDASDDYMATAVVGDDGYNVGDLDKDGKLDVFEEWRFESTQTAEAGKHENIGTVIAETDDGRKVSDTDTANYTGNISVHVEKTVREVDQTLLPEPTGDDLCDDLNDVGSLTFVYTGANSNDKSDFQPDGKSSVITYSNGDVNGLANVRIIATDESDFTKIFESGTDIYFDGQVALGEAFTASGDFAL
jgi:hypothetical protein